jgi:hypothetical protein
MVYGERRILTRKIVCADIIAAADFDPAVLRQRIKHTAP